MDNNMLKFIKIRNSYTIPKIVELSINEKALLEYEKFCLELMNQVKKQKEVINKAIDLLNAYIGVLDDTSDLYFENVKSILELEVKEVSK